MDDDLIGDDRPPSRRRGAVLAVAAVLVLGGLAVPRLLDRSAHPPAAAAPTASPGPGPGRTLAPGPTTRPPGTVPRPSTAPSVPLPWAGLPVAAGAQVDFAVGERVRSGGHDYALEPGDLVLAMERAVGGPVLLVQSRGSTVLEQLRPDGSRLVLEAFHDESRLPRGLAVDPSGRLVAYGTTSGTATGPSGLVVRDLSTGAVVAARSTRRPYGVRGWVGSGVVLAVALDPGGPPYRWVPGEGAPQLVTPGDRRHGGPLLLAAAPDRTAWAVTGGGCTGLVTTAGARPQRRFCRTPLGEPAAWSPTGESLVARGDRPVLEVLDLRTGRTVRLDTPPRVFVAQVRWSGSDTVLVALHTLAGRQGAVLRCRVGGPCHRVALGPGGRSTDLVLAL